MVRVGEIKLLLQGLPEIPNPPMAAVDPLPETLQLPRVVIEIHHLKYRLLNQANPAQYLSPLWLFQMMLSL